MWNEWWTWVGIAVAGLFAVVGVSLLWSARGGGHRITPARASRDSFRNATERSTKRRAAFIVNATKIEDIDGLTRRLTAVCRAHDMADPLILTTTEHDIGFGQTREAVAAGADVVCAYGGDGTVRVVAQELVGTGVPLGLLPQGTGNLLARNLELPVDDFSRCLRIALTGRNRHIDAAWLTLDPDDAETDIDDAISEGSSTGPQRHAFFVMAGLGLDAAIMDSTPEPLKKAIGWTAYIPAGLKNSLVSRFKVSIAVDSGPPQIKRARTVLVGNCGKITGGIDLLPDAEPDDGTLDVVILAPRGPAAWAKVATRVLRKSERTDPSLMRYRCQTANVRVEEPQKVQLDGDIIGEASHVQFDVEPAVLIVRTERSKTPRPAITGDGGPGTGPEEPSSEATEDSQRPARPEESGAAGPAERAEDSEKG